MYWLAGWLAIQGDPSAPTIGDIVAFTTLQSRLFFPLGQLLNVQVEIQGALALFDRIFEYLEMDPEIVDAPDAVALDPATCAATSGSATSRSATRPRLSLARAPEALAREDRMADGAEVAARRAVDRGRRDAVDGRMARPGAMPASRWSRPFALEDVDFEAEPGELVALVGPSGSGKTTTTYLIPRLYDVDCGRGRDRRHRRPADQAASPRPR